MAMGERGKNLAVLLRKDVSKRIICITEQEKEGKLGVKLVEMHLLFPEMSGVPGNVSRGGVKQCHISRTEVCSCLLGESTSQVQRDT